jgi:Uma2 family endonuclease
MTPPALLIPPVEIPVLALPTEDGVPLETNWHCLEISLRVDCIHAHWADRRDDFAGGNMFIYFSLEQARRQDYRGPDFFLVQGVDGARDRDAWVVWEEEGRYPDLIIELSSPSTEAVDRGPKKRLYERTFRTPEYFCYSPDGHRLDGWHRANNQYAALEPNEDGRMWSEVLGLWLGNWEGAYQHIPATWLRFYTPDGQLVPTQAEAQAARADAQAQRAEAAEAEVARLRAELERVKPRRKK